MTPAEAAATVGRMRLKIVRVTLRRTVLVVASAGFILGATAPAAVADNVGTGDGVVQNGGQTTR
jgi:hypothetical protein